MKKYGASRYTSPKEEKFSATSRISELVNPQDERWAQETCRGYQEVEGKGSLIMGKKIPMDSRGLPACAGGGYLSGLLGYGEAGHVLFLELYLAAAVISVAVYFPPLTRRMRVWGSCRRPPPISARAFLTGAPG